MTPGVIRELGIGGALLLAAIVCFTFAHKLRRAAR